MSHIGFLLGDSDATLRSKNKKLPPAAPSRGAVEDNKMKNRSMSQSKPNLQLSARRGKAELCLDNNTVFRDAPHSHCGDGYASPEQSSKKIIEAMPHMDEGAATVKL